MTLDFKRAAFDELASRWDLMRPPGSPSAGIDRGLGLLGPLRGLTVVDLGCGTGRLTGFLLERLEGGAIIGVDFSPEMIARAREKFSDPRLTWLCREASRTGLPAESVDVILCFDSFPHFPRPEGVFDEVVRCLRGGGRFLLWHDIGRERLAEIHRKAGPLIENDVLPPIDELARLGASAGLSVQRAEEDESSYTYLAIKSPAVG